MKLYTLTNTGPHSHRISGYAEGEQVPAFSDSGVARQEGDREFSSYQNFERWAVTRRIWSEETYDHHT